jgi:hypothetical protein
MTIMAPSLFVLILLASATSFRMGQRGRFKLRMQAEYEVTSDSESHKKLTFKVAGKPMSFETGKIGRQASGAVVGTYGDSMVYSTACFDREATAVDFTPLRVDWFARFSAVGQTVGAFHRRDSRGDDNEILVARLIDRPLRPMIADGWQHETQVLSWVLSYDKVHALEPLSICTASAAMAVSAIPFTKPVAGVELGLDPSTGQILVNPTKLEKSNSTLHLVMAGTDEGILMIEGVGDFIPEAVMVEALEKVFFGVSFSLLSCFASLRLLLSLSDPKHPFLALPCTAGSWGHQRSMCRHRTPAAGHWQGEKTRDSLQFTLWGGGRGRQPLWSRIAGCPQHRRQTEARQGRLSRGAGDC